MLSSMFGQASLNEWKMWFTYKGNVMKSEAQHMAFPFSGPEIYRFAFVLSNPVRIYPEIKDLQTAHSSVNNSVKILTSQQ